MRHLPAFVSRSVAASASSLVAVSTVFAFAAPPAHALPWVFKYDEFPDGLQAAANQIDGGQFYTQPGFVAGEAFGQIYRPAPEMFPLQILGFDLILAAPPYATEQLFANATIEVYNSDSKTPDPGVEPVLSIATAELFNPQTQEIGFPLTGNTGLSIQFDLTDEDNRPPVLDGGSIWLVVRFNDPAMSLSQEWGDLQCLQVEGLICGCQNVGTVHDSGITKTVNVIHHVAPIGACSGASMQWSFMENIPATGTGFTIDGDVILRLRADVAEAPCEPVCDGQQCGDDGCGGSCGTCGAGLFCVDERCVSCQPDCLFKQCGDDGCDGTCGTCGAAQTCGDDQLCHDRCEPACDGRECGDDGCGGACGTCGAGLACDDDGRCAAACAPACDGKDCGPDGCGGACGACGEGLACVGGQCEAPCAPACDGKACGGDGCGGTCGTCGADATCDAGACVALPTPFTIAGVSPASALAQVDTPISITGTGFAAGAQVKIGASDCTDEVVTGDGLISATVPAMTVGTYSVIVVNPDAAVATLPDAFTVLPNDPVVTPRGGSQSGCAGTDAGADGGAFAALAGLAALAACARSLTRPRHRAALAATKGLR